jgi:hypothetical protein
MKFLSLLVLLTLSSAVLACTEDGSTGFVPDNTLQIPVGLKTGGGLTEAQFNAVIKKVEDIYVPVCSSMKGNLKIARKWTDGTVNANATRLGSIWNVNMYGGLARHQTITEDGFALVLCHEIGHQIGGAPKVSGFLPLNRWASNEGQADYWATLKCLRHVFLNDNNEAVVAKLKAPDFLVASCAKAHPNKDDKNICIRTGMAGNSVADLFAALNKSPLAKFDTPDTKVVSRTNDAHPATQCRMDTYFQGSLCEKGMNEEVDQKDEVAGTCHVTTGQTVGIRPACWFKTK